MIRYRMLQNEALFWKQVSDSCKQINYIDSRWSVSKFDTYFLDIYCHLDTSTTMKPNSTSFDREIKKSQYICLKMYCNIISPSQQSKLYHVSIFQIEILLMSFWYLIYAVFLFQVNFTPYFPYQYFCEVSYSFGLISYVDRNL